MSAGVTERPLRIAMLGWALPSLQEREGSGYNLSASELAAGLAERGHSVLFLRAGIDYAATAAGRVGSPTVVERETWRGVRCFDGVNFRNVAPGNFNFRNIEAQIASPRDAAVVVEWLRSVEPDVVHIHSMEPFGFDLIAAIKEAGFKCVATPHNYYWLCPQIDLLARERDICTDYEGGERCVGCIGAPEAERVRRERALVQTAAKSPGLRSALRVLGAGRSLIGAAAGLWPRPGTGEQERTGHADVENGDGLPESLPPRDASLHDELLKRDRHLVVLNDYGRRRAAAVTAMNRLDRVLCPGAFLLRVYEAMGVRREILEHVPLGQPHFDRLRAAAEASPFFDKRPWDPKTATRPLRFAYFGNPYPNKGLATLARAVLLMPEAARARMHLMLRVAGDAERFRRGLAGVPQVSFHGAYRIEDTLGAAGEFDVGILPSTGLDNSPLVLLEFLNAGKFAIASRLGGPTGFVREWEGSKPGNGVYFRAADAVDLARVMTAVVAGEITVPSPREVHGASDLCTHQEHVAGVEGVYRGVISAC